MSVSERLIQKLNMGAANCGSDDILLVFEMFNFIAHKSSVIKKIVELHDYTCLIHLTDTIQDYWIRITKGKIEYGSNIPKESTFTISLTKNIALELFFGEIDANVIFPLGKISASGNIKKIRFFQELFEDSIDEFKKLMLPKKDQLRPDAIKEIQSSFYDMLEQMDMKVKNDTILEKDLSNTSLQIQWNFLGVLGFQIFKKGEYQYKYGEILPNPDLTLEFTDKDTALRFLRGELDNYSYIYYENKFKLYFVEKWEEIEKEGSMIRIRRLKYLATVFYAKNKQYHPFILSKLPIFRNIVEKFYRPEKSDGSYIPINLSLGTFNNQILPEKIIQYFIEKASTIFINSTCGCRFVHDCQKHDPFLGCMYLGEDVKNIKISPDRGHFATKREAIRHMKKALKSGLVPTLGRYVYESSSFGVDDTGHFMSMCFCCPCCCINGKMNQNAILRLKGVFKRLDGLTITVDPDKCVGCGTCLDVCIFKGRTLIDGKANINQELCLGCGRCEGVCPNHAISMNLDDPKRLDEFIKRIEQQVDVS